MRLRMKIPRQPARYGAECSISVHREACYCLQNCVFCRAVNSNILAWPKRFGCFIKGDVLYGK